MTETVYLFTGTANDDSRDWCDWFETREEAEHQRNNAELYCERRGTSLYRSSIQEAPRETAERIVAAYWQTWREEREDHLEDFDDWEEDDYEETDLAEAMQETWQTIAARMNPDELAMYERNEVEGVYCLVTDRPTAGDLDQ